MARRDLGSGCTEAFVAAGGSVKAPWFWDVPIERESGEERRQGKSLSRTSLEKKGPKDILSQTPPCEGPNSSCF